MRTIRIILIAFLAFTLNHVNAQQKVIDSSTKKQPAWILNPEPGFVIVKGDGQSLEESKSQAIALVRESVLQVVVDDLLANNSYLKSINLDETGIREIIVNSALYTDITIEKAEQVYWEKLKDKQTKSERFNYHVKYPFKQEEVSMKTQDVVFDYELSSTLGTLREQAEECKTIEDMNKVWEGLMFLNSKFTDEDKRKTECEEISSNMEARLNSIEVKEMLNSPGKLIVALTLNEKGLLTSKGPKINSNCATVTKIESYEEQWTIHYNYSNCSKAKPNVINVEFENSYNKISKEFSFDPNLEKLEIKVSSSGILITNNKMATVYLASMYRANLIIDRIVLRFNDLNFTDTKMNQLFDGAGMYDIGFSLPPDFNKVKIDERIKGEVHFRSEKTGQRGVYYFYNQKVRRK